MAEMINDYYYATGRRKRASARVFMKPGAGKATVNGREIGEYLGDGTIWLEAAVLPLKVLKQESSFDLKITVTGGGVKGQAGAIAHGIARALDFYAESNDDNKDIKELVAAVNNEEEGADTEDNISEHSWHKVLRKAGLLTRDSRRVYRKKVGLRKSRKAKQFSKR